jgi:hypothetical protein
MTRQTRGVKVVCYKGPSHLNLSIAKESSASGRESSSQVEKSSLKGREKLT